MTPAIWALDAAIAGIVLWRAIRRRWHTKHPEGSVLASRWPFRAPLANSSPEGD